MSFFSNKKGSQKNRKTPKVSGLTDIDQSNNWQSQHNDFNHFFTVKGLDSNPLLDPTVLLHAKESLAIALAEQLERGLHNDGVVNVIIRVEPNKITEYQRRFFARSDKLDGLTEILAQHVGEISGKQLNFNVRVEEDLSLEANDFTVSFGSVYFESEIDTAICRISGSSDATIPNEKQLINFYDNQVCLSLDKATLGDAYQQSGLDKISDQFCLLRNPNSNKLQVLMRKEIELAVDKFSDGCHIVKLLDRSNEHTAYLHLEALQPLELIVSGQSYFLNVIESSKIDCNELNTSAIDAPIALEDVDTTNISTANTKFNQDNKEDVSNTHDERMYTYTGKEVHEDNPNLEQVTDLIYKDETHNSTYIPQSDNQGIRLRLNRLFIPRICNGFEHVGNFYISKDGQLVTSPQNNTVTLSFNNISCHYEYQDKSGNVAFTELQTTLNSLGIDLSIEILNEPSLSKQYQLAISTYIDNDLLLSIEMEEMESIFGRQLLNNSLPNFDAQMALKRNAAANGTYIALQQQNNIAISNYDFSSQTGVFSIDKNGGIVFKLNTNKVSCCHILTGCDWLLVNKINSTQKLDFGNEIRVGCFGFVLEK